MITNTNTSVYKYFEGFEDPKFYINLYQIKACSGSKIKDAKILLILNNCEEDFIQLTRQAAFAACLNRKGRKIQMLIAGTETNRAIFLRIRQEHRYPIHEWSTEGMSLDTAQTKLDQACKAVVEANLAVVKAQNEGEIKEKIATLDKCRRTMEILNTYVLRCFQGAILEKAKKLGSDETLVCIGSPVHFQESTLKALTGYNSTQIRCNPTPLDLLMPIDATLMVECQPSFDSKLFLIDVPGSSKPVPCPAALFKNPANAKIGRNVQILKDAVKYLNVLYGGTTTISADKEYKLLAVVEDQELEKFMSSFSLKS